LQDEIAPRSYLPAMRGVRGYIQIGTAEQQNNRHNWKAKYDQQVELRCCARCKPGTRPL
jgi:hypothetical protein